LRKAEELLAAEGYGDSHIAPPQPEVLTFCEDLPEAPASVNVHLTIGGWQVQLTLRDTDETRLLARLAAVLAQYPVPQPMVETARPGEGYCAVHNVQMKWNEGRDGKKGWWSHRVDDTWCKGK
jgi:hypothetical protein